jgi:hypothetical protein
MMRQNTEEPDAKGIELYVSTSSELSHRRR